MNQKIVELAQAQIGIKEATGKNDGVPSEKFAGGRREAWCAHFVAWLYRECGKPLPGDVMPTKTRANPIASVKAMHTQCARAKLLVENPEPGDVIFFNSRGDSDAGNGWHVGIVESTDAVGVNTIEGNSANGVYRRRYKRDGDNRLSGRIVGFARMV